MPTLKLPTLFGHYSRNDIYERLLFEPAAVCRLRTHDRAVLKIAAALSTVKVYLFLALYSQLCLDPPKTIGEPSGDLWILHQS